MKIILAIGLGSCLGGIARYLLGQFVQHKFLSTFPYGTLSVNLIGCFLIGIVFALGERGVVSVEWRFFLATGFLGGFTTFSSFSNEAIGLFRTGQMFQAFTYILSSVVIGLLATFAGIYLTRFL